MNFLAHIYLSGNNPYVIIGNFMATASRDYSTNPLIKTFKKVFCYTDKSTPARMPTLTLKAVPVPACQLWALLRYHTRYFLRSLLG